MIDAHLQKPIMNGNASWMANHRIGETGLSESAGPSNQALTFGVHGGFPAAANFFDQEGSAYFGELEEALMQGVAGIRADAADRKPFLAAARPPPTLEIFPSWPMRFQQSTKGNSQSAESTDSGSAQNTAVSAPPESDSPVSRSSSGHPLEQHHQAMAGDVSGAGPASASPHPKPQEKRKLMDKDGKPLDAKTLRRLAQNREAARKSRMRKKAYVQQLETSRVKLTQLEQDLQRARSQGMFLGGVGGGAGGNYLSSGAAAIFDMEYARWLEGEQKQMTKLRGALQAHLPDGDLRAIVDGCVTHYDEIFRLKGAAAKADVFHLITGMWASAAERCFLWMGGFRPSEMIQILTPQLDPVTDQQVVDICSLQQSSLQAEDALTKGFEQLQQSLADTVSSGSLGDATDVGNYMGQMAVALGKLSNLEGFIRQADNLRQETLHQLCRILTIRQAAKCFVVIGEYHNRLRALSSLWASRPRDQNSMMAEEDSFHQQVQNHHFSSF